MRKLSLNILFLALSATCTQAQETLTLYPHKDAYMAKSTRPTYLHLENTNYGTYPFIRTYEWTSSGYPFSTKSIMDFDLSDIPADVSIKSATLYLYATGNHATNITKGSSSYKSNATSIRRVIEPWEEDEITWNTCPDRTSFNEVIIPNSQTVDEDYTMDITGLIKDMLLYPESSHGVLLELVNPIKYTEMRLGSSDHAVSNLHPKLVIEYYEASYYQIGEGTLNYPLGYDDINPFSSNLKNSKKQFLYKADELKARGMSAGNIYSLGFDVLTAGSDISNLNVYVKQDTISTLSSTFLSSGFTNVFSDAHVPYQGWNSFNFSTPFYWDGVSNLIVEVCFENAITGSPSSLRYSNVGSNLVVGESDDGGPSGCSITTGTTNTIRPNTRFHADIGEIIYSAFSPIGNYTMEPSSSENYIRIATALTATTNSIINSSQNPHQVNEEIQYFDGLGRPIQSIAIANSQHGLDMVKPITYDEFGRTVFDFLPYPAANQSGKNGGIRSEEWESDYAALNDQLDYYQDYFELESDNPHAYSKSVYEASPLNRVLAQGAPGDSWQPTGTDELSGHTQRFEYTANTTSDEVRLFEVNSEDCESTSYYDVGELYKSIVYDENYDSSTNPDAFTTEYKDKQGRVVMKESYLSYESYPLRTYYVYDDFGLLRFVLPPAFCALFESSSSTLDYASTNTDIKALAYYYEYDARKRMIKKQLPGAEQVYMVYDDRDRLVLTQDGEMRGEDEWLFTTYDHLNRPTVTGIWDNSSYSPWSSLSEDYNNFQTTWSSSTDDYQLSTYITGTGTRQEHTKTYYDNYDFADFTDTNDPYYPLSFNSTENVDDYVDNDGTSNGYFDFVKGLVTGSSVLVLDDMNTSWIYTTNFYDDRYRVIQTNSNLFPHTDGVRMASTKYDFTGNPKETFEKQSFDEITNTTHYEFIYDHALRPVETWLTLNQNSTILLAQNSYNSHGELAEKNLHCEDNTTFLQSVDYKYNIRGWLTNINDFSSLADNDVFSMELIYDQVDADLNNNALYNGNIAATKWSKPGSLETQAYIYGYDEMNRLQWADYRNKEYGSSWDDPLDFNASYDYDLNGNLTYLQRNDQGGQSIDMLFYEYEGNQLATVEDGADLEDNSTLRRIISPFAEGPYTIKTQYLLTISELQAAGLSNGDNISAIAFYVPDAQNSSVDIEIRMMHSQGVFPVTSTTQHEVYTGTYTVNQDGWNEINIDDFTWNSSLEIVIEINKSSGTEVSENVICEITDYNSTYRQEYSSTDYYQKRPIMRLKKSSGALVYQPITPIGDLDLGFVDGASESSEYSYDDNGNMTKDENKGIDIAYNFLNLPKTISTIDGTNSDQISYIYDATGIKWFKKVEASSDEYTTYYGSFVYKASLEAGPYFTDHILTSEGWADTTDENGMFYYALKDHLGNTRAVLDEDRIITQSANYFPFGMTHSSQQGNDNKYLYNGKEIQDDLLGSVNLDWYDYGARFYDPALGRWHTQDPLAEKYYDLSTYNYCINNPIIFVDPDGRDGMVTGTGTKEDPYVITANYYYENGSLDEDQITALNEGISDYNELGGESGVKVKNEDGSKSYVKYNLSAEGVDDIDEARADTRFETTSGETRYYGNKVGTETGDGDELGSANNFRIDFNQSNIDAGVNEKGYNKAALMKGIVVHEIGHNLGGEHSDGTSTMQQVITTTSTSNGMSTTSHSYPSTSRSFLKTIFQRRDTRKAEPGDGRVWTRQ